MLHLMVLNLNFIYGYSKQYRVQNRFSLFSLNFEGIILPLVVPLIKPAGGVVSGGACFQNSVPF